ncbi:MAG: hypothetical protein JW864_16750 [Spirochaetes bacterium]|nr:hypothetical protein [Spirochaetota bacterium]
MKHHSLVTWEKKLKQMMDEIDDYLEKKYGDMYPLHPSRRGRGKTSNKEHDGLFNIGSAFSPGFGSDKGKGYIVDIDMVTLSHVPDDVVMQIESEVVFLIKEKLSAYFPDRELNVEKDGSVIKIYGDLSLGSI